MQKRFVVLPGDGIGPEVIREAVNVLEWFQNEGLIDISLQEMPFGLSALDDHGQLLPEETRAAVQAADAVLFGAMGGPEYDAIPADVRRRGSLLTIRRALDVYANVWPIIGYPALADASPFKTTHIDGVDYIILRELCGGLYFGEPRGIAKLGNGVRRGTNTMVYDSHEIERIARTAFELARRRRGQVTSVDKSNVLDVGRLWRQVVTEVWEQGYSDVSLTHMLVDNCALQLVRNPKAFDVVVMENTFGDILSDGAAVLSGSLGMIPSASLASTDGKTFTKAVYEPIHGSAPDIAGQGIANPLGAILSAAMALDYTCGKPNEAERLSAAVRTVLGNGPLTPDLSVAGSVTATTRDIGAQIIAALAESR